MLEEKENLRKQDRLFWLLGFIFCSLVSLPAHAAQLTRDLKEIKVAYPPSMASVTLMTAIKQKFFDEEGLRPVLLVLASDLALKSQVAGEIDYTLFGGGSGILAAAQGLPIKTVHLAFNFADLTLVARPEIKASPSCAEKRSRSAASPAASIPLPAPCFPVEVWIRTRMPR
jgi:ABC-type nitrate/sulfonate/bicarbonate transport system substrate-binding protein